MTNVYKKLMQARIELQNTKLSKSGHNKFAGYTYFELGDFLPTVQTIFSKIGLCGVISFGEDLATLTIVDVDAPELVGIVIQSPMKEANLKGCHPIQNLGAVETYTRRYLWVTALEIVEHDILDATTGSEKPSKAVKTDEPQPMAIYTVTPEQDLKCKDIAADIVDFAVKELWDDAFVTYDNVSDHDERIAVWTHLKPNSAIRTKLKLMQANKG